MPGFSERLPGLAGPACWSISLGAARSAFSSWFPGLPAVAVFLRVCAVKTLGLGAGGPLILADPFGHAGVRFYLRGFIYEVIFRSCLIIIFDHGIVYYRSGVEVIDDGRFIDIRNSYRTIVGYGIEGCLGYYYSGRCESKVADDDGRYGYRGDDDSGWTPVMMRIIDFGRGQRDPTDICVGAYPGDPSRIPAKSDGGPGCDLDDRCGGRPVPSAVDDHPVAIMVGNVSKRLIGHPDLIAVIIGPSADGEGLPIWFNSRRPPELAVFALIINPFPRSGLLQVVGVVLKLRREYLTVSPLTWLFWSRRCPARRSSHPMSVHGPSPDAT